MVGFCNAFKGFTLNDYMGDTVGEEGGANKVGPDGPNSVSFQERLIFGEDFYLPVAVVYRDGNGKFTALNIL